MTDKPTLPEPTRNFPPPPMRAPSVGDVNWRRIDHLWHRVTALETDARELRDAIGALARRVAALEDPLDALPSVDVGDPPPCPRCGNPKPAMSEWKDHTCTLLHCLACGYIGPPSGTAEPTTGERSLSDEGQDTGVQP